MCTRPFSLPWIFKRGDGLPPRDPDRRPRLSAYNWSRSIPAHHTTARPPQRSIVRCRLPLTTVVYHTTARDSSTAYPWKWRRQTIIIVSACTSYATWFIGVAVNSCISSKSAVLLYIHTLTLSYCTASYHLEPSSWTAAAIPLCWWQRLWLFWRWPELGANRRPTPPRHGKQQLPISRPQPTTLTPSTQRFPGPSTDRLRAWKKCVYTLHIVHCM